MSRRVIIVGGGAAGMAAALSVSSKNTQTILIESDGSIGGELCSGMPILGAYSYLGEPCVTGVLDELMTLCKQNNHHYIGPVCDYRTVCGLCVSPEVLRLAIYTLLRQRNIQPMIHSRVVDVEHSGGRLKSVTVLSHNRKKEIIECDFLIDATGGGHITQMCGGQVFSGDEQNRFQPISLIFRMAGVNFEEALRFVRDNPNEALLAENPLLEMNASQAAQALYEKGYPYYAVSAEGSLLGNAIASGDMYPCTAVFITPNSVNNQEVCLNTTRISGIDCLDSAQIGNALPELYDQVGIAERFLQNHVPGFSKACLSAVAYRIGIRETSRIDGEYTLQQSDVVDAVKHSDGVARGCHHVDLHGAGTEQIRIPVKGDGIYDIPMGALIPKGIKNVLVAGRCLASDRGANGSARVMGTCIDTGQAAARIISTALNGNKDDVRDVEVGQMGDSV